MESNTTQEPPSPSASSIFLPLGRRSRRGSQASVTSEAEKENLTEALDQIHNAASQMGTLTVFNEYTNPPAQLVAVDNKSLVGDLQGGLSGLYNIFKASVGGVRDMVGGPTKPETTSKESGNVDVSKGSSASTRPADSSSTHIASTQASATSSPVVGTFPLAQEGAANNIPKASRIPSKAASISSKTSLSANNSMKSPLLPLSKMPTPSTADPTVTEINVNAVKDGLNHHRSGSGSLSTNLLMNSDTTASEQKDKPLHISASQISQDSFPGALPHSPVLSAKAVGDFHKEIQEPGTKRDGSVSPKLYSSGLSRGGLPLEFDTPFYPNQSKPNNPGSIYSDISRRKEIHPGASNPSLVTESGPSSVSNSMSKLDISASDGNTATTLDTSASTADRGLPFSHSSKASLSASRDKLPPRISQPNLPRFMFPDKKPSSNSSQTTSTTSNILTTTKKDAIDTDKTSQASNYPFYPRLSQSETPTGVKNKLLSKEFWMRDENAKDCFYCGEPFSTFRRKHHCRVCGQIFDAKCTTLISGISFGHSGSIRVCKPCDAVINAPREDSSDFSGDDIRSPVVINTRTSEPPFNALTLQSPVDDDAASTVSQSLDHVLKPPTMAIPATRRTGDGNHRRSAILEIDSDRQLARPTSSRSLKSGISRSHSVPHKRHHSRTQYIRNFKPYHEDRAPFQRRFGEEIGGETKLSAFHRDNIIDPDLAQYLSDDASTEDDQPNLFSVVGDGTLSRSGGDSEKAAFGGFLAAVKKGRSRFGEKSGLYSLRDGDDGSVSSSKAVNLPRSVRRRNLSVASSVHQRISPRASRENPSLHYIHDHSAPPFAVPSQSTPNGFKMTRSASMRGDGAPAIELNKASLEHVRKLLHQQLHDALIPNYENWETALLPILLKATDDVEPDVQHGDDMDIRHYVKLKKIPGGRPSDTAYVSGLVFTKNLALKSMPRTISHPRILIVTFALEYARQQQHFMSLEPVIRQEREFLENLVNRIAALNPNLLLVTKHVSGLALQLLEKANIATVYNVKESVIEAVSRCTQTRIITSLDRLAAAPSFTGQCASFDLKTYVYKGRKKTYMYISGCPKELGCTIVLRGANNDVLMRIKRITEFMVYVVYNLKLETCLMRDEFAKIPSSPSNLDINGPKNSQEIEDSMINSEAIKATTDGYASTPDPKAGSPQPDISAEKTAMTASAQSPHDDGNTSNDILTPAFYEDMVEKHQVKILSASPFVKFRQPYLLMRARELERQLAYLKRLRDQDFSQESTLDEKLKSEKFFLITPEMIHESLSGASSKVKEVVHAVHDAEYDRALHHYQTQKRQWEAYISGNINLFDPYAHQNIVVLYSLVCTKTSIPCSGPDTFALGFYDQQDDDRIFEGDCTLGQYVEGICHSANAVCTANGCDERMVDHHRQYVHGEAQVSVFVQPYPSKLRGLQDTILMWSCCKICGNETPAMPMSDSTWRYSFGKYLELSFSSADLHARAGVCPHDLHRDHLRYFGLKDVALRMHYDPINLLEIIVPRPRVTWKVDKALRVRNEVYLAAEKRVNKFMASVKGRLKSINVESVMPEIAQSCQKEVETLIKRANDDHTALIREHQARYMNTRYWEVIPLNTVIISTQEKVVEWDAIFADFEQNYFPSEKDIRRLATLQLKKIFLDRDVSVTSLTSSEEAGTTAAETEEGMITPSGSPRLTRRMTLSPQEAKNMLASVVQEHTAKPKMESALEESIPQSPEQTAFLEGENSTQLKPIIASENEFRHLDLAIPSNLVEKLSPPETKVNSSSVPSLKDSTIKNPTPEALVKGDQDHPSESRQHVDESQGRHDVTEPVVRPSGLPRPRDRASNLGFRARSPPLTRAQSQPAHLKQQISYAMLPQEKPSKPIEDKAYEESKTSFPSKRQRLTERLRLTGLKSPKLPSGPSLIPRSITKSSHVSYLTRHFEELSREFQKERIMQNHRRTAQGKQSRAYPMASSKPIVEVYKNVRDAVEEREPGDEDFLSNAPTTVAPKEPKAPTTDIVDDIDLPPPQPQPLDKDAHEPRISDESLREDHGSEPRADGDEDHSDDEKSFIENDGQTIDTTEETQPLTPEEIPLDLKELPKHERTSLVKMLTNFWAERSASGWAPLDYPLSDSDHIFADCDIIVREDEPSSLIAFALNSEDYQQKLKSIQDQNEANESAKLNTEPEVEQSLLRSTGTHLKYQFQEGQAKMLCKVFYAEQFDALRRKCGVADRIVESLSRCMKWDSKGGKTKSVFLKTLDDRFILKSLSTIETQAFLKFAPDYFQIMSEALFHELPSVIAKMFGFYQVIIKNPITGIEFNWFLLIMENLFYDRAPTRIFDLKGSMRNRKVQITGERNEVLLDENMVEFIYESPLFTREHSKKLLSQSVWNDTLFLARQNVMDYSLMIAIDEAKQEIVVGIIDCIRTYTWDKKLESWIKDRGFAGGGKNRPTVTSPKEYKSRFREAMARYVLYAPDSWHQFHVADPEKRSLRSQIQSKGTVTSQSKTSDTVVAQPPK